MWTHAQSYTKVNTYMWYRPNAMMHLRICKKLKDCGRVIHFDPNSSALDCRDEEMKTCNRNKCLAQILAIFKLLRARDCNVAFVHVYFRYLNLVPNLTTIFTTHFVNSSFRNDF